MTGVDQALIDAISMLDNGSARVAEIVDGQVVVHEWLRRAILLYLSCAPSVATRHGPFEIVDKIQLKTGLATTGVRALPGSIVRWGAHVERGAILMPCFVNIGARVGSGTMIDTWATVGSCVQVGRNVHISGGVGLGGALQTASTTTRRRSTPCCASTVPRCDGVGDGRTITEIVFTGPR